MNKEEQITLGPPAVLDNSPVRQASDAPELTLEIIQKYINPLATEQEAYMFLRLCQSQQLNPFLREAYLIKFSPNEPASIVVGKDTFLKRAQACPGFDGFRAGVIVKSSNSMVYRDGAFVGPGETLLGGWAEVYRKDWSHPTRAEVSLTEYLRRRKDGSPQRPWAEMPATMIRKVPLVQALRETFPDRFAGMYSPEEMPNTDTEDLPKYEMGKPVEVVIPPEPLTPPEPAQVVPMPEPAAAPTPAAAPKPPDTDKMTEAQAKLWATLKEVYGGELTAIGNRLEQETTFTKNGVNYKGKRNILWVKDVSCDIIRHKLERELDEMRHGKFEGGTPVTQIEDVCFACAKLGECSREPRADNTCPDFIDVSGDIAVGQPKKRK
jgi:phage recombination protein Bet